MFRFSRALSTVHASVRFLALPRRKRKMGGSSPDFASRFMLRGKPPAVIGSFSPTEAWTRSRKSKAAKNVFAGVFAQIESILFSSENRYTVSEPHYFRVVFSLYANRNKARKICCAFLFSFDLTFLCVVSQFSSGLPFAVDRSLRESPTPFLHG